MLHDVTIYPLNFYTIDWTDCRWIDGGLLKQKSVKHLFILVHEQSSLVKLIFFYSIFRVSNQNELDRFSKGSSCSSSFSTSSTILESYLCGFINNDKYYFSSDFYRES